MSSLASAVLAVAALSCTIMSKAATGVLDADSYQATLTQLDEQDGGGWLASYPDLPGCYGHGRTQIDALSDGAEAVKLWIIAHEKLGVTIPRPKSNESPSGNIRVRVPKVLHKQLVVIASLLSVSLNALVSKTLREELGLIELDGGPERKRGRIVSTLADRHYSTAYRRILTWNYDDHATYNGEWVQRLDPQLHHQLRFRAEEQGVSINALIMSLLGRGIGRREAAILTVGDDNNGGGKRELDCEAMKGGDTPQVSQAMSSSPDKAA